MGRGGTKRQVTFPSGSVINKPVGLQIEIDDGDEMDPKAMNPLNRSYADGNQSARRLETDAAAGRKPGGTLHRKTASTAGANPLASSHRPTPSLNKDKKLSSIGSMSASQRVRK